MKLQVPLLQQKLPLHSTMKTCLKSINNRICKIFPSKRMVYTANEAGWMIAFQTQNVYFDIKGAKGIRTFFLSMFFLQRGKGSLKQRKGSNRPTLRQSTTPTTVSILSVEPRQYQWFSDEIQRDIIIKVKEQVQCLDREG